MNWYIAKIVYEIICGEGHHAPQFDEQLRLIQASGASEALTIAIEIGQQEAISFQNDKQQLVQWKFIAVPELHAIATGTHGAELFSRIREVDDAPAYREVIFTRAHSLQLNQTACQAYHFLT